MSQKTSGVENRALQPVPPEERKGWLNVAFIQAGVVICVPSLMLGQMLVSSMSTRDAILSGVIGFILVCVVFSLMGMIGSDLGLPTCMTAVPSFGAQGAKYLVGLFEFITSVGWFAVQTAVCGQAFSNLCVQAFHVEVPPAVSMAVWGVIMLITAVYGIQAMDLLNKIAVPALFVLVITGCIMALNQFGTSGLNAAPESVTMTIPEGIVLTMSFMASGCLVSADVTRYQKSRKETILSTGFGVFPAGALLVVAGALMTQVANQYDITLVFSDIGLPIIGMIVLIAATWTTNTSNAYAGGLSAVLLFHLKDEHRAMATLVTGLVGTVLAMIGFSNYFEEYLSFMGDFMIPMLGIIIADYWIVKRGDPTKYAHKAGFNVIGVVAWLSGYAIMKLIPIGFPFLQGVLGSMILYVVGMMLFRRTSVQE